MPSHNLTPIKVRDVINMLDTGVRSEIQWILVGRDLQLFLGGNSDEIDGFGSSHWWTLH